MYCVIKEKVMNIGNANIESPKLNDLSLAILQNCNDGLVIVNKNRIPVFINSAARKILNLSDESFRDDTLCKIIAPEKNFEEFKSGMMEIISSTKQNNIEKIETYLKNNLGHNFPAELSFVRIEQDNEPFIGVFIKDITEKVSSNEEIHKLIEETLITKEFIEENAGELLILNAKLEDSESKLLELNASKDKFFSIIAHDLRNPIQAFLAYLKMLGEDFENLSDDELHEAIKELNRSAKLLYRLLENLLQWSRLQRGDLTFNPINFDLSFIINQNIELVNLKAREKKIKLTHTLSDDLSTYADVNMVDTVLRNLISNALKFTPSGGEINISAEKIGDDIILTVSDSGVGMSQEVLNNLFSISHKHTSLGTHNEKGSGLGLILCKDMIAQNDGSITVESEIGKGSRFIVTLPSAYIEE